MENITNQLIEMCVFKCFRSNSTVYDHEAPCPPQLPIDEKICKSRYDSDIKCLSFHLISLPLN